MIPDASMIAPKGAEDARANSDATPRDEALREASAQFEALLLRQVFKDLKPTSITGQAGGVAGEFYQGMFVEHICDAISQRGVGLADVLARTWAEDPPLAASDAHHELLRATALEGSSKKALKVSSCRADASLEGPAMPESEKTS